MSAAIAVENLSKSYRISHEAHRPRYQTLRDSLGSLLAAPFRAWQGQARRTTETFWALKDVSFEVQAGEVVGIIGRNGAGKSTLLKILSRITRPTNGQVSLHGRVGSLLEVGTGFHPELSGRENIFLNGAILGMSRREITRKFDEIVAFAEVEQFLDLPVKRYSSGMYVRLAFAVAAHFEPEILLVDEVLAVGDVSFQKKCLGKMGEVARAGRTVVFVSHNLGAVGRLCQRGVHIADGQVKHTGPIDASIASYIKQLPTAETTIRRQGISVRIRFLNPDGSRLTVWKYDTPLVLQVDVSSEQPLREPAVDVACYADNGTKVFALQSDRLGSDFAGKTLERFQVKFQVHNTGIACSQLAVDLGIRANKDPRHLALWERVEIIPLSLQGAYECAPDALLCLPCRFEAREMSSDDCAEQELLEQSA